MKRVKQDNISFLQCFTIFIAVNTIAASINHIDDTDETYGYWEPLHFTLFGKGMQTWEYSPEFGIRTYSFILPLTILGKCMQIMGISGIQFFFAIRVFFGVVTAYCESDFIFTLSECVCPQISFFSFALMLCSPGMFYVSTSYLPSALVTNVIMLSVSAFLKNQFQLTIFWGCIGVLWSGWPFVGVVLLPLGLTMLLEEFTVKGVQGLAYLVLGGVAILIAIGLPPVAIDTLFYGKILSPTWNILVYNAFTSGGDELYGVAPASYYVRNLFLTLGLTWPLAILSPLVAILSWSTAAFSSYLKERSEVREEAVVRFANVKLVTLGMSAFLWIGVLFSRPHKEERFMYPVYPLLALCGAVTLQWIAKASDTIFCHLHPSSASTTQSSSNSTSSDRSDSAGSKGPRRTNILVQLMLTGMLVLGATLCMSRVVSNYVNYSGHMRLWTDLSTKLQISNNSTLPVRVCTGGDWYLFPSHFFLPANARLEFVEDNFHGLLPQYFSTENGTSSPTGDYFNDRNREDRRRYVELDTCDYVVTHIRGDGSGNAETSNDSADVSPLVAALLMRSRDHSHISSDSATEKQDFNGDLKTFRNVMSRPVIDADQSLSALARAFYIPFVSARKNVFRSYTVFSREE